jgi:ATP-dependent Zn protease
MLVPNLLGATDSRQAARTHAPAIVFIANHKRGGKSKNAELTAGQRKAKSD